MGTPSENLVVLLGRVSTDVDLKHTAGGTAYARFNLVTTTGFGDKEKSQFHRLVAWGKTGEAAKKYVGKGQQLYVRGYLNYGSYQKAGATVHTTEVVVEQMRFIGGKETPKQEEEEIPW
jgi:single-strand DNA-binding protein